MEDKTVRAEFRSPNHPVYEISGSAQFQGSTLENIVFNTGEIRGTKIIEANNGESAEFVIQFGFTEMASSITLECEAGIVSEEPAQSIIIPLDIKYIKS